MGEKVKAKTYNSHGAGGFERGPQDRKKKKKKKKKKEANREIG